MCVCVIVTQSYPTLCSPINCSPPGSSVHGILQARILEWVAMPFSRGSSQPKDRTWVSLIESRFFTIWSTWESRKSRDVLRWWVLLLPLCYFLSQIYLVYASGLTSSKIVIAQIMWLYFSMPPYLHWSFFQKRKCWQFNRHLLNSDSNIFWVYAAISEKELFSLFLLVG